MATFWFLWKMAQDDPLIEIKEMARLLGVTTTHVRRLVRQKKIPAPITIAYHVDRWRRIDFEEWVKNGCKEIT